MSAARHDFTTSRYETFRRELSLRGGDGNPVNIDNYTGQFVLMHFDGMSRKVIHTVDLESGGEIINEDRGLVPPEPGGKIILTLDIDVFKEKMPHERSDYYLVVTSPSGDTTMIINGAFVLTNP